MRTISRTYLLAYLTCMTALLIICSYLWGEDWLNRLSACIGITGGLISLLPPNVESGAKTIRRRRAAIWRQREQRPPKRR